MINKTQKGFTIIELIVVIAIMAVLSGIIVTNIRTIKIKANAARVKQELANVQKAIVMFYTKYGDYPGQEKITGGVWSTNFYPTVVNSSSGEPYLVKNGETYYLSEFLKMEWTDYNASYINPTAYYYMYLSDTDHDGKIGCVFIYSPLAQWGYVSKNLVCQDCPGSCGYSYFYII